ncbi:RNA-binding protein 1-like [Octopus sinensis]|uniref:RNA-binding protein 1-like n=1 Tax=Octopus sinensis TaxID=2607531 RepID=A0A6P7U582_9MOLL|nr:RNA-binding protein 1-like [Octopus sinensis]
MSPPVSPQQSKSNSTRKHGCSPVWYEESGRRRTNRSRSTSKERFQDLPQEDPQNRLHIGDLGPEITEKDLITAFKVYGDVEDVWVAKSPPCFGFVIFRTDEDATEAMISLDGARNASYGRAESRTFDDTSEYEKADYRAGAPSPSILPDRSRTFDDTSEYEKADYRAGAPSPSILPDRQRPTDK